MGDNFPYITLHFAKEFDAFFDVLQCVLRYIALRFTMKWKIKHRRNVCVSTCKRFRFYIETHVKLDI